jgi:hypothetical protein
MVGPDFGWCRKLVDLSLCKELPLKFIAWIAPFQDLGGASYSFS